MSDAVIALGSQDQLVARLAANRVLGRAQERALILLRMRKIHEGHCTSADWQRLIQELMDEQEHDNHIIQMIKEKL